MDCQARGTKVRFIHYRETLYPTLGNSWNICSLSTLVPVVLLTKSLKYVIFIYISYFSFYLLACIRILSKALW